MNVTQMLINNSNRDIEILETLLQRQEIANNEEDEDEKIDTLEINEFISQAIENAVLIKSYAEQIEAITKLVEVVKKQVETDTTQVETDITQLETDIKIKIANNNYQMEIIKAIINEALLKNSNNS